MAGQAERPGDGFDRGEDPSNNGHQKFKKLLDQGSPIGGWTIDDVLGGGTL